MLPVHVPVIIPWPCRGLKDQRGPWDPSCDRHGMDKNPTWPLARGCVDPRPIFGKIPGKRPGMVLGHEGLIEVHFRPLQAASGVAVRSFLTQVASSGEDNIVAFFQGRTSFSGALRQAPSLQRAPQGYGGISALGVSMRYCRSFPTPTRWPAQCLVRTYARMTGWRFTAARHAGFPRGCAAWASRVCPWCRYSARRLLTVIAPLSRPWAVRHVGFLGDTSLECFRSSSKWRLRFMTNGFMAGVK